MDFKTHRSVLLCLVLLFMVSISGYRLKINGGAWKGVTFAELSSIAAKRGTSDLRNFVKNVTSAYDKVLRQRHHKCVGRTLVLSLECSGCNLQMGLQNQLKTFVHGLFFASLTNRTLCVHQMKSDYLQPPNVLWEDVLDFDYMNRVFATFNYPTGLSKVSVATYSKEDVKYALCLKMRSVPHNRRDFTTKIPECEKLGIIDHTFDFTSGDALIYALKHRNVNDVHTLFVGPWNLYRYHRTRAFNYGNFIARVTASLRFSPIVYDYVQHLKEKNHLCEAGCTKAMRYVGVHLRLENDFLNYTFVQAVRLYEALGWLEPPKEPIQSTEGQHVVVAAHKVDVGSQSSQGGATQGTVQAVHTGSGNSSGIQYHARLSRKLDPYPYFDYQISEYLAFVKDQIPSCRWNGYHANNSSCFDGPVFIASGLGKDALHYADSAVDAMRTWYGADKVVAVTKEQIFLADYALKEKYDGRNNSLYGKFASGRELLALLDLVISSGADIFLSQVQSSFSSGLASFGLKNSSAEYINNIIDESKVDSHFKLTMTEVGGNDTVLVKTFRIDDRVAFQKLYADDKNRIGAGSKNKELNQTLV
jgi:hypothetical protein